VLSEPRQERLARNESFFREVNERIREVGTGLVITGEQTEWEFICECPDPTCTERVATTVAGYEAVRSSPTRFLVAPGHQAPEIEQVVAIDEERAVVEKHGAAGEIAAQLDPRRPT
jgi:hypothetical protein